MTNEEAKFILRAYRPNGVDAQDPVFAEALDQANRDPALRAWLEQEQALDRLTAAKLGELAPPRDLRAAILAGARVSQPRRRWTGGPWWLAAAAVLAVMAAYVARPGSFGGEPDLARLALGDLARSHDAHVLPDSLASLQAQFEQGPRVVPSRVDLDLPELRRKGCRTVRLGGREVFELCFQRNGAWFHLYVAPREDFPASGGAAPGRLVSDGAIAATSWSDRNHVYALVTDAGEKMLRQLL